VQDVPKFVLKRIQETEDKGLHPDADLLTAFAEQSLVESERTPVMEHLASCSECREVVALTLPATDDVVVTTSRRPTRSVWSGWTVLRWSVVAAGIVAITSVGILQYRQSHLKDEGLNAVLTAQNEKTASAEPSNRPPSTSSELQEIHPRTKNGERAGSRNNTQSNRQDNLGTDKSRALNQIPPGPRGHYAAGSGMGRGVGSGSGGQAAVGAKLAPSPNVGQQPEVPSSSETVEVESQAVAVAPITESQLSDQLVQEQKQQPLKDDSSKDLEAVRASPRWSINSDGRLQRSLDTGDSWVDVNPELAPRRSTAAILAESANEVAKADKKVKTQRSSGAGFRALAAFGTEVWAGGSAAMLYHSRDSGAHWTRVLPSSSGATLTGDITSIEFSDPQHGRISTSNGEVWITAEGGQTWRRQ
jgi:Photosynthesis system II assembly factor YCF48